MTLVDEIIAQEQAGGERQQHCLALRFDDSGDLQDMLQGLNLREGSSSSEGDNSDNPDRGQAIHEHNNNNPKSSYASIESLKDLQELRLSNGTFHVPDISKAILGAVQLKVLDMDRVRLQGHQVDFERLAEALQRNSLESFSLTEFSLATQGCIRLDGLLKTLGSLPKLHSCTLEAKRNTNVCFSRASIAPLCSQTNLHTLGLSGVPLGVFHVALIANAIKKRDHLKVLRLHHVSLDDQSAGHIAAAIAGSNAMYSLDLSANNIGDLGCKELAEGLKKNRSIRSVQLYGNKNVRSKGIAALARMLEVNHNISRFDAPVSEDRENRVKIEVCLSNNREIARTA